MTDKPHYGVIHDWSIAQVAPNGAMMVIGKPPPGRFPDQRPDGRPFHTSLIRVLRFTEEGVPCQIETQNSVYDLASPKEADEGDADARVAALDPGYW